VVEACDFDHEFRQHSVRMDPGNRPGRFTPARRPIIAATGRKPPAGGNAPAGFGCRCQLSATFSIGCPV
jgi:hypothetical protein